MSSKDINTDTLIRYLDGELQGRELADIEQAISENPSLQQELESLRSAQLLVKSYGLRQQVGNIHAQMMEELKATQPSGTPVRSLFTRGFRVAASIILVIGIAAAYQYATLSARNLFDANYTAYSIHQTRGEQAASRLEQLYLHDSMQLITTVFPNTKEPSQQDYFYTGNAYLQLGNAPDAIRLFTLLQQKNAATNQHMLEEDTEYYLAMAYLLNREPGKALPLLTQIHNNPQHLYHDKVSSWFLLKAKLLRDK
ncbi:MAG: hypothetical protein INR73_09235 [Williamsia sp.]|nr:hypothetical protein [Williamsia sp.]